MAGHATGDGVDGEADIDAAFGESVIQFADFVLGLRDGHAVSGDDDDFAGGGEDSGGFFGAGAFYRASFLRASGCGGDLAEGSEDHVGERTVHGLRHDDREDESGRAVEGAGDDEQFVVEDESHGSGGETGIRIQERDDRRHVGAADGDDEHDAEHEGDADHDRKQMRRAGVEHEIDSDHDGNREHGQVKKILTFEGDGALGQDFLQFSGGHQAAGDSEAAENHFQAQDRHLKRRDSGAMNAEIVLGGANEGDAKCTEGVAEGGPLRDGGHLDEAEGDADGGTNAEGEENPGVVDADVLEFAFNTELKNRAANGEDHTDFAGEDAAAGSGRGVHPLRARMNKPLATR